MHALEELVIRLEQRAMQMPKDKTIPSTVHESFALGTASCLGRIRSPKSGGLVGVACACVLIFLQDRRLSAFHTFKCFDQPRHVPHEHS